MISIVMSYFNRQTLLDRTIESIKESSIKDYELIIVDDKSDVPVVCSRADSIIRVTDKWYINPCVAWNKGIEAANGDIILLQSPECYHIGDILKYVEDNIKHNTYLSFACYAINARETAEFHNGVMPNIGNFTFAANYKQQTKIEYNGWYNHSKYRPVAYHFCSAMTKDDMDTLGGFDERYASGISFDDDDFIRRIRRKGMEVKIVDSPYVLHQYHPLMSYHYPNMKQLHSKNKTLFNSEK